jgi:hypothetical protein
MHEDTKAAILAITATVRRLQRVDLPRVQRDGDHYAFAIPGTPAVEPRVAVLVECLGELDAVERGYGDLVQHGVRVAKRVIAEKLAALLGQPASGD